MIAQLSSSAPLLTRPALDDTLCRVRERNGNVAVRLGRPDGPGWLRGTELIEAGTSHLSALLERVGTARGTDRRDVPASFFFHGYSWILAAVGVGAYLVDRRVPRLAPEAVAIRFNDAGTTAELALLSDRFVALPDDAAVEDPSVSVTANVDALRDVLRVEIETHLAPLVDAVRARSPLGRRALWLLAADNLAWSVLHHAKEAADGAGCQAEVAALTQAPGSPLRGRTGVLEVAGDGRRERVVARASCCLNHKLSAGGYCAACPLLPAEERLGRLVASLSQRS